ncbi:hypothetical protein D0469_13535 [Peribacillus saganii]|uniref:Uncharacterized protein n=1 Tax=Peribacillus saganii TaxID=2303992 RepID=A0A372LLN4_9BACI|nr:hypothetical protein [Peribacillus saganii]RFU67868.1 hypothetical protein D0469_13535 [Peribacillus saganii]
MEQSEKHEILEKINQVSLDQRDNAQNRLEVSQMLEKEPGNKELMDKLDVLSEENKELFNTYAKLESKLLGKKM